MTNERALDLLHRLQTEQFNGEYGDERREALDMAVRALSGDGDTISRQQAIEVADAVWSVTGDVNVAKVWDQIRNLPSAQPERKTGRWISEAKGKTATLDEFGNVSCSAHCSECGDWLTASDEYDCRGRFCPNCGAKMEVEHERLD